jgi:hypothetical protein
MPPSCGQPAAANRAGSRGQDRSQTPDRRRESRLRVCGHLAAYAGLAPVTRRSGSSIRGELPSRCANKQLKRAMFLSALAAPPDPVSRAYYARKISQGKRHNQALIALARCRAMKPLTTT